MAGSLPSWVNRSIDARSAAKRRFALEPTRPGAAITQPFISRFQLDRDTNCSRDLFFGTSFHVLRSCRQSIAAGGSTMVRRIGAVLFVLAAIGAQRASADAPPVLRLVVHIQD